MHVFFFFVFVGFFCHIVPIVLNNNRNLGENESSNKLKLHMVTQCPNYSLEEQNLTVFQNDVQPKTATLNVTREPMIYTTELVLQTMSKCH